jgi:hypothetical protein
MGIEAALVHTVDGREVVVVAVRQDVISDPVRTRATLDVLASAFPGMLVVLATSTSQGLKVVSDTPAIEDTVRTTVLHKREPLTWQRYAFAPVALA